MADINQVISLGIGTPSSIEHFILVGLNTEAPALAVIKSWRLQSRSTGWAVKDGRDVDFELPSRSTAWTVEEGDR